MKRLALTLGLILSLAACAGAQLTPVAQPIKVRQLPACNQSRQNLQYLVVDAIAAATCQSGGSLRVICVCIDGDWTTMSGAGSFADHGGLVGLADDDHTQYPLLAGRGLSQTLNGGTAAGGDFYLHANAFDGSTLGLSLESTDDVSDTYIATLSGGPNYSPSFRAESDAAGLAAGYADVNGVQDTRFTHGSGRTLIGNMNFLGVQVFGWEGIFGLGGDATNPASLTCLDMDTDRLYGDKDCDSTKDAGEEYLDQTPTGIYLPLSSAASVTVEVTGAGNDFTLNIADFFDMIVGGDISIASTGGFFEASGTTAGLNAIGGISAEIAAGPGTATFTGVVIIPNGAHPCYDDGAGTAATLTLLPATSHVDIYNLDANGCVVTMSEVGVAVDSEVQIVVVSTAGGSVTFADTAGVSELAGAYNMGLWDSLDLSYKVDRWVETGRSNN